MASDRRSSNRRSSVVCNRLTPIDATLDGSIHSASLPLWMAASTGEPNARLVLQLVATTVAHARPLLGGSAGFRRIRLELPAADHLAAR